MKDAPGGDQLPCPYRPDQAAGSGVAPPARGDTPASTDRIHVVAAAAPPPTRVYPVIPPHAPSPPARLGQYRLLDRLGQGGMGAVYRAEHLRLKRDVAIKVLSPGQANDHRAAARFQLEMEVVGRIDHPNVVRATDAGEAAGVHYLVMELIDGVDLARLLARRGPLPIAEACEVARQAAAGLQAAHDHGLVHRDVKPSNLMLTAAGRVKVLDLGLALLRPGGRTATGLTGVGEVMGTAEYMAPEQWTETHAVDGRADVYSLGCTLFALLTGESPFQDLGVSSSPRMMLAHQQSPAPRVTEHRPDVPAPLAALLARMLAKNPDDRPATPRAVAAALRGLAAGADLAALAGPTDPAARPVVLRRPTPAPPPRRRADRVLYALVAVLVIGTSAVGLAGWLVGNRPPPNAPEPAPSPEPAAAGNAWKNLLAVSPGEQGKRLWFPAVEAVFDHNPAAELLTLQSPRPALIRLGGAPARAYRLQVGLRQVRWEGGVGVYFGGRAVPPGNEFVFQFLTLHRTDVGPDRPFALGRGRGTAGAGGVAVVEFATQHLPAPGAGEHLLELELRSGGLAAVRWDGVACPELVGVPATTRATRLFPDGGLEGEFGVFCNGAAVTVSTARYSLAD